MDWRLAQTWGRKFGKPGACLSRSRMIVSCSSVAAKWSFAGGNCGKVADRLSSAVLLRPKAGSQGLHTPRLGKHGVEWYRIVVIALDCSERCESKHQLCHLTLTQVANQRGN